MQAVSGPEEIDGAHPSWIIKTLLAILHEANGIITSGTLSPQELEMSPSREASDF